MHGHHRGCGASLEGVHVFLQNNQARALDGRTVIIKNPVKSKQASEKERQFQVSMSTRSVDG
jgi:hypothetical protein